MFDEATFDGGNSYVRTPNLEHNVAAAGESLNPAALHDLCMMYLEKTAYEGITPDQLAEEYFLAKTSIDGFLRAQSAQQPQHKAGPVHGKLQNSIRPEPLQGS